MGKDLEEKCEGKSPKIPEKTFLSAPTAKDFELNERARAILRYLLAWKEFSEHSGYIINQERCRRFYDEYGRR